MKKIFAIFVAMIFVASLSLSVVGCKKAKEPAPERAPGVSGLPGAPVAPVASSLPGAPAPGAPGAPARGASGLP